MLLYQPTPNEIAAAAARAKNRKPHLGSRLEKAAAMLADINRYLDCAGDGWQVRSQTDPDLWYAVGASGCSCEDYRRHAPVSAGYYYCKHLLVYYGYRRMLANVLNRRLVGNLKYTNERRYAQVSPGSILVDTDRTFRAITYTGYNQFPRHLCYLRLDTSDRFVPRTDDDYVAVAEWLPSAPPFETKAEEPRMEDYTPELPPEMSLEDYRYWLRTGDAPSLRNAVSY